MYTETEKTLKITIQPTNRCNLACSYCYQTNKGKQDLEIDKVKCLLDKVFEHDNGYFKGFLRDDYFNVILDFIGGEATLNMELVDATVSYFIKLCVEHNKPLWLHTLSIWLQTNGTTYFNSDVQAFLKKYHFKIDLPITIDGSKKCHDACRKYHNGKGSYDDVAKAVKAYMQEYKVQPNTKITISPSNVRQMFDSLKNMIDLGYRGCRISCTNNEVWSKEDDESFKEQLSMFYDYLLDNNLQFGLYPLNDGESYGKGIRCATCGADGGAICIDCNGDLFLCQSFSSICDMHGKTTAIGTVESGITEEGAQWMKNILKRNMEINNHKDECTDCPCSSICEYCPAAEYMMSGGLADVPHIFTRNCNKHKTAYELLKKYKENSKMKEGAVE